MGQYRSRVLLQVKIFRHVSFLSLQFCRSKRRRYAAANYPLLPNELWPILDHNKRGSVGHSNRRAFFRCMRSAWGIRLEIILESPQRLCGHPNEWSRRHPPGSWNRLLVQLWKVWREREFENVFGELFWFCKIF